MNQKFIDFYELLNSLIKNKKIIKKYKIRPIRRYLPGAQTNETQEAAKKEGKKANQQYTYKSRARKQLDKQAGIPVGNLPIHKFGYNLHIYVHIIHIGTPGVMSVTANQPIPPNRPNEELKQFVQVASAGVVEKTYDEIHLNSSKPKKLLSNRQNSRNSVKSSISKQDSIRDEIEFKLSVKLIQHSNRINE
jgi:hypothetical protein